MVDLPLLVTRPDATEFFNEDERVAFNDDHLWVEADADRGALGGVMADLRDNVLGVDTWTAMPPTARIFVATAERLMREYRRDQSFDFSTVLVQLCKALEVQVNALLAPVLREAPPTVRYGNNGDGVSVDYAAKRTHTAGQLVHIMSKDRERMHYFTAAFHDGAWLTQSLAAVLDELADLRNGAAHSVHATRDDILPHRNQILGVGSLSVLTQLARVRRK
jgi:hypothetical protein